MPAKPGQRQVWQALRMGLCDLRVYSDDASLPCTDAENPGPNINIYRYQMSGAKLYLIERY